MPNLYTRLRDRLMTARQKLLSGRVRELVPEPAAQCERRWASRHVYAEFAGPEGVDATRFGDWEYSGRCTDFF